MGPIITGVYVLKRLCTKTLHANVLGTILYLPIAPNLPGTYVTRNPLDTAAIAAPALIIPDRISAVGPAVLALVAQRGTASTRMLARDSSSHGWFAHTGPRADI